MVWMRLHTVLCFLAVIHLTLIPVRAVEETRDCRELEFKDLFGNCKPCKQCDPGQELSKECGFGYGEDARCVPCRSSRFKEDRSLQKCKPCLDCGLINRFLNVNCSSTSNAVCGDCLPGYYKKTRLSGFQDMECIPCGSPPPPYEPHCGGRVNLVPLPSVVTSPQDMVLATVICSALATVLLALLVLCIIYCKRQLLEEKPSAASLRSQGFPYTEAEISCLDPCWLQDITQRPCCRCHVVPGHTCGPVHLIPSHCCDEGCSLDSRPFQTPASLGDRRDTTQDEEAALVLLGRNPDFLCEESEKMNGVNSRPLGFRWPQCNSDPTERRSEEEEERGDEDGCKPKKSPAEQIYPDSLSPRQHLSSEEG